MIGRWLARLWWWLISEPRAKHPPYPRGDPPSDRGGMAWPDD